ncbi:MAG: GNAT family N-acetyltransferase [Gordonia sp. (in: high G+C Gram-positive bacteria)]
MIVETHRMRLRPVDPLDIDDLVQLDSDPAVMRFVSGGLPTSRTEIADWVVPRAQSELRGGRGGMWVATDERYHSFLGWIVLRAPRHSHRPELELSYRLRRETWGRGLATEAARAIVTVAFDSLGAQRVFASTTRTNTPSLRVMKKLEMSPSTDRPDPAGSAASEHHLDDIEYELLRARWSSVAARWYPHRTYAANLTA